MIRARGFGAFGTTGKLWRIAVLAAAGAIGSASQAEAALYYWSDPDPGYYRPAPPVPQRQQRPRHRQVKKLDASEKEQAKPQGPLIIAISIERQNVRIYDANGFFAEAPISTGMKGHPTPMGVFSVIQKHKLHHSNIYSGAPMPYMQRITWSGVAMHAGVLPGYPASHGCVRMPMAFAMKMWNWTKMGARVVVTPGEMTPAAFSHPLLPTQKVMPQPITVSEPQTEAPPAPKSDKASEADTALKPAVTAASLELRSTVGHNDGAKPAIDEPSVSAPLREQTHTADASGPAAKAPVTMSDAAPSGASAPPRDETSAQPDGSNTEAKSEAANSEPAISEAESATGQHDEITSSDDKPAEASATESVTAETKTIEKKAGEKKAGEKKIEASADDVKAAAPKPEAPKSSEKSDAGIRPVTEVSPGIAAKKDQGRLLDAEKPAAVTNPDPASSAAPKRTGQIAVFISRKDGKIYVRQNFAPLFEAPVTIAPGDRPLGTHVFTVQVDKNDSNLLHWSVVSLPAANRRAERRDEDERALRRRKIAGAVEIKPMPAPDSPAEALDRLTIPADTMARIAEALTTGGSIIVSDQGINAGETGEGTDFIVSLR